MEQREYDRLYEVEQGHFWFRAVRSIVRDQLPPAEAGLALLDVGCGTGGFLAGLPSSWRRVGTDFSPKALSFSRTRGLDELVAADAGALPFGDASFDAVAALDVVEHCADDRKVVSELARVLKPGGTLVVTVPAFQALWSEHDDALHHLRRYRRHQVRALFAGASLELRTLSYFNTLLFPAIAAVRLAKRLLPKRGVPQSDAAAPPKLLNEALWGIFSLERALLRRIRLPVGVSILAVATRSAELTPIQPGRAVSGMT